jgi:hypothetical protein
VPENYATKPLFAASAENRLLNEFFLYVLQDLHTAQGLSSLQFTSDEPHFVKQIVERVYLTIPATPTASELPATRAFSRQLVAYLAAFLPVAPFFKNNDTRIAGICDDQYTSTLDILKETGDDAFRAYMTRKTQGWFRRWGRCIAIACGASPAGAGAAGARAPQTPGGAGGATGAATTPARVQAPAISDDDETEELIVSGPPVPAAASSDLD